MNTELTVPDVLRRAATRVRQKWCQGSYRDDSGGVCALGAIEELILSSEPRRSGIDDYFLAVVAEDAIEHGLCLPTDELRHRPVPLWNDAPGQTAENVACGLELAALLYEQKHAQQAEQPQPEGVRA